MSVLIDTGVWYTYCDPNDRPKDQEAVLKLFENLAFSEILLPWPVSYEVFRTKFSKNRIAVARFEGKLKSPNINFINDADLREDALNIAFEMAILGKRPMSMVDCLLRLILDDQKNRIDQFITFNAKDFHDVCRRRKIEMIDCVAK